MAVLELPADSLSLSDLRSYIVSLEERGQNTETYALAFWQKICLPFSTGSMVLLSLTFIFGSTRLRNAGQRILAGMLVGILFYLANQIFGHLGVILNLPPLLMTLLPIAAILAIAWRLLKRAF
jgi:lipopolysaccharide export system permease protein